MTLYKLLLQNPLLACALCLCLLAAAAAIRLVRKLSRGAERFLAGFVGLVAVYEGLKILIQAGIWKPPHAGDWTDAATFTISWLFVLMLFLLQELGSERFRTRFLLRIFEAVSVAEAVPKLRAVAGAPSTPGNPPAPAEAVPPRSLISKPLLPC